MIMKRSSYSLELLLAMLWLAIFLAHPAAGQTPLIQKQFQFKSYRHAIKSPNRLSFTMESTKLGIVTTSFIGLAKDFTISYRIDKSMVHDIGLIARVLSLDTDNPARDHKMHRTCFDHIKWPELTVMVVGPLPISAEQGVELDLTVRGHTKRIKGLVTTTVEGGRLHAKGRCKVGLKELGIPDPSIWVAKVRDEVLIDFDFALPLTN